MDRNVESHFQELPKAKVQRSIFRQPHDIKTSFNAGELIPFLCKEVLPGDTFQPVTAKVVRCQTMLTPIMDNLYLDTYYFFVPNRIIWKHWKEFCGENTQSAWAPTTKYKIPAIKPILWRAYKDSDSAGGADDTSVEKFAGVTAPTGICGFPQYSIGDYLGFPTKIGADTGTVGKEGDHWKNTTVRFSALPFRAYAKVCDHFFRDENITDPLLIPDDDGDVTCATMDDNYVSAVALGGKPFKVSKYHDYFTSCLPEAQKGDPVQIPVDVDFVMPMSPVITTDKIYGYDYSAPSAVVDGLNGYLPSGSAVPLYMGKLNSFTKEGDSWHWRNDGIQNLAFGLGMQDVNHQSYHSFPPAVHEAGFPGTLTPSYSEPSNASEASGDNPAVPLNLIALGGAGSAKASSFDINQFRLAYVTQCFLEKLARGGSRYGELVLSLFGVSNPDSRLQDPEYLGGNRCPIQVEEVVNTAQSSQDFLGDVGAKCQTNDVHADFIKSFTEHGILLGLMCIRYDHSYCQGVNRSFTREDFLDFYNPVFANLGEMPVYKHQMYASPSTLTADEKGIPPVFGYQEAWADYRFSPNMCTGEMRPNADQTLSQWHLAEVYDKPPTLSDEWIREDAKVIDRVIAVSSSVSNQFWADIFVQLTVTRAMPMFSVPGLEPRF